MAEKLSGIFTNVDRIIDSLGVWVVFIFAAVMMVMMYALGLNL